MAQYSEEQINSALFVGLVMSFGQAAMINMGKVPHPMTGKIEIDSDEAAQNIDLLSMLQQKTMNNLSREEQTILETTLTNVRLTYVAHLENSKKQGVEQHGGKQSKVESPSGAGDNALDVDEAPDCGDSGQ